MCLEQSRITNDCSSGKKTCDGDWMGSSSTSRTQSACRWWLRESLTADMCQKPFPTSAKRSESGPIDHGVRELTHEVNKRAKKFARGCIEESSSLRDAQREREKNPGLECAFKFWQRALFQLRLWSCVQIDKLFNPWRVNASLRAVDGYWNPQAFIVEKTSSGCRAHC